MIRSTRIHTVTLRLLSILAAVLLIWLSLRGVDLIEFSDSMRSANYRWILPVIAATLLSHWIRAYRWQVLVHALPETPYPRASVLDLFSSIMIGYMVNYALPRVGEIARCTHLSARKKFSFSALLGTVAIERIADILALAIGLFITLLLLRERLQSLLDQLSLPQLSWTWIIAGVLTLGTAIYLIRRLNAAEPLRQHLSALINNFTSGMQTVYRTPQHWRLIWTTVAMWMIYGFMAYIPLLMFNLQSFIPLSYWDGLAIMFIGVLGILVPTPGGAGSYHFITILALTLVYGIAEPDAAAYAVFVHGAQLILYLTVGGAILLSQAIISRTEI